MASNNIYEDQEKENIVYINPEKRRNMQGSKNKQLIFTVLNKVSHIGYDGQQGKISHYDFKNKEKRFDITRVNSKRTESYTVPVEQCKNFLVYEDQPSTSSSSSSSSSSILLSSTAAANKDNDEDNFTCTNISKIPINEPLKVIIQNEQTFDSPIPVPIEMSSPMSIDKILYDDKNQSIHAMQWISSPSSPSHNECDKLFEVMEYQNDILEHLRDIEKKYRPKPTYMRKQPHINHLMRSILINWLVEIVDEYDLHSETLHLAISYIDRFLSIVSVVRSKLQLVGTAAMFIAAKYEEIYPPNVDEFSFITDDAYTNGDILKMEQMILRTLHFDLFVPTNLVFINAYAVLYKMPDQVKFLATYIAELSILYGDPYLEFLPSQISSGSLALTRFILDLPIWCPELEKITSYSLKDLKDVILFLCHAHNFSIFVEQQAIQEKYKTNKYMKVSTIESIDLNEETFISILTEYDIMNTLKTPED